MISCVIPQNNVIMDEIILYYKTIFYHVLSTFRSVVGNNVTLKANATDYDKVTTLKKYHYIKRASAFFATAIILISLTSFNQAPSSSVLLLQPPARHHHQHHPLNMGIDFRIGSYNLSLFSHIFLVVNSLSFSKASIRYYYYDHNLLVFIILITYTTMLLLLLFFVAIISLKCQSSSCKSVTFVIIGYFISQCLTT
jgi:hypothetical protein